MKTLKQNQTDNHQEKGSKREDKKKTNIKFNSVIFFQVGLVIALVASAWAMNLKIGEKTFPKNYDTGVTITEPDFIVPILEPKIIESKPIAKVKPRPVKPISLQDLKAVPDDKPIIETNITVPINTPDIPTPPIVKPPVTPTPPVDNGPTNIIAVEFVPVFPGCETAGGKDAKIACLSDKIGRFVGRKFKTTVADDNTQGTQQIYVQFKIDKNGDVVAIKARAKDKNLEKEAQRVISKLPKFTPGRMGDVPVDVMYSLPIKFNIE